MAGRGKAMTRSLSAIVSITLMIVVLTMISSAHAGPQWKLEDRIAEVELTPDGKIRSLRYEGEEEFVPVEDGVVPSRVAGLSFYARDLQLSVYLAEKGYKLFGIHSPWVCRTVLKDVSKIEGPIFVQFAKSAEDVNTIKYPDGQVVRISGGGSEVDFGGGPELPTFWYEQEAATGLDFLGFRTFTLFEFFDPQSEQIISRNIVAEAPFQ
jgi:hypothetical protein